MSLQSIYQPYASIDCYKGSDKGTSHKYLETYERLFEPLKNDQMNVLEIGTCSGAWLEIMQQYFPNANIFGMDIDPKAAIYGLDKPRIDLFICDATTVESLDFVADKKFKIIIDDGSHRDVDIIKTFNLFYSKLDQGGTYVIEDVHVGAYPFLIKQIMQECISKQMTCEVVDLRPITGRFDDVMCLITWNK